MKIGSIEFAEPFISLAPLAGYGDIAFRRLCREFGASLTVTEMVSVKGLVYGNEKTEVLLNLAPCEKPSCVQLFGSDPEFFYKALNLEFLNKFDIIDINMGCPVPKVTKCGEGSALMRDPERAADIVRACVSGAKGRPVTVKHRLGISGDSIIAPEFAYKMQQAGCSAVTVHGRTAVQGYGGVADWEIIAKTAQAVKIPVIGNGDITNLSEAEKAVSEYCCAGVAIGRAALGRPYIFSVKSNGTGENVKIGKIMEKHINYALEYFPEAIAVRTLRKHLCRYLSHIKGTKELRLKVNSMVKASEIITAVRDL